MITLALAVAAGTLAVGLQRRSHSACSRACACSWPASPTLGRAAAPRRAALGLGDVPHGRRRQDPRRCGGIGDGGRRGGTRARIVDRAPHRPTSLRFDRARRGRARALAHPKAVRASSPSWARRSTRWPTAWKSLFDARRELVAAASHDLRAPVASIAAMLEAIEDGLATPTEYLAPLQDQARRLTSLVDDLFELARIDAGSLAHELREVALAPLVESCVRGFEAEARARNVTLENTVTRVPEARCAPEQVERVMLNLLTNALRHTPVRRDHCGHARDSSRPPPRHS